jgi:hypothetical protein
MSERAGELLAGWIARTAEAGAFPKDEADSEIGVSGQRRTCSS